MPAISTVAAILLAALLMPPAFARDEAGEDLTPLIDEVERLMDDGKYAESESMAREVLPRIEARYGEDSAEVATLLNWLVETMWRGGKATEEALGFARRGVRIREALFGPESKPLGQIHTALGLMNVLAELLWHHGEIDRARDVLAELVEIRDRLHPDHPFNASALINYGRVLFGARVPADAVTTEVAILYHYRLRRRTDELWLRVDRAGAFLAEVRPA
jgi:hypothetical protein